MVSLRVSGTMQATEIWNEPRVFWALHECHECHHSIWQLNRTGHGSCKPPWIKERCAGKFPGIRNGIELRQSKICWAESMYMQNSYANGKDRCPKKLSDVLNMIVYCKVEKGLLHSSMNLLRKSPWQLKSIPEGSGETDTILESPCWNYQYRGNP